MSIVVVYNVTDPLPEGDPQDGNGVYKSLYHVDRYDMYTGILGTPTNLCSTCLRYIDSV